MVRLWLTFFFLSRVSKKCFQGYTWEKKPYLVVRLEHVGPGGAALLVGGPLLLACVLHGGSRVPPRRAVGLSRALLRRSLLRLRLRLRLRLLVLLRLVLRE